MITLPNGSKLVETADELPRITGVSELFADVETLRVFDHKKYGGLYPWKGDRICGIAVTVDDHPETWYVPVRHTRLGWNIELPVFQHWLKDVVGTAKSWINHNLLFDVSFARFDGAEFNGRMIDTLTLAKIHDSDRIGHRLEALGREWCNLEMSEKTELKAYLKQIKSKDYADVPADILGNYACADVMANRVLYRYLQKNRPPEVAGIWETEIALAPILHDMEWEGLKVDRDELRKERLMGMHKMIQLATSLTELTGTEFTNSFQCIYDILINRYGLPVLATKWEKGKDTGRPTFDKRAMPLYAVHPLVTSNPEAMRVVKQIAMYKKEAQYQSLFVEPFLELMDDNGFIHPSYNPVVRTGRMSSKRPNSQQQNKRSKKLIHPEDGYGFLSSDYSQIEYRLIAHYCDDPDMVAAYCDNPDMDFHQWVADMLHVKRKAGKTLNFGMAYGAGKKKVTAELTSDPDIAAEVGEMVAAVPDDRRAAEFARMCSEHAARCYQAYHERFPGIKRTADKAAEVCRWRGYVFNAYGRRRHLPAKAAHKAFNSIVQGCAMDLIKERMIAASPRNNDYLRKLGVRLAINVHDEVVFKVPLAYLNDTALHDYLCELLCTPRITFKVPIRCGLGISTKHWSEAAGDDTVYSDGVSCEAKNYKGSGLPVAGKLR